MINNSGKKKATDSPKTFKLIVKFHKITFSIKAYEEKRIDWGISLGLNKKVLPLAPLHLQSYPCI